MCILIVANEAFGRSEMPTVSHQAHYTSLPASVQRSWCRLSPGHNLHKTQHRVGAFDSQVNRKRKRTSASDEECTRCFTIWVMLDRTKKGNDRETSFYKVYKETSSLNQKAVINCRSIYWERIVTALILSYKCSHIDFHRRLIIMSHSYENWRGLN